MDWSVSLEGVLQLIVVIFLTGAGWMKISVLERDHQELKEEVRDFRGLREDMAVVKTQLAAINECLHKLASENSK